MQRSEGLSGVLADDIRSLCVPASSKGSRAALALIWSTKPTEKESGAKVRTELPHNLRAYHKIQIMPDLAIITGGREAKEIFVTGTGN